MNIVYLAEALEVCARACRVFGDTGLAAECEAHAKELRAGAKELVEGKDSKASGYPAEQMRFFEKFAMSPEDFAKFNGRPREELLHPANEEKFKRAFERTFGVSPEEAQAKAKEADRIFDTTCRGEKPLHPIEAERFKRAFERTFGLSVEEAERRSKRDKGEGA